jgi:outer membrane immunogenic protein
MGGEGLRCMARFAAALMAGFLLAAGIGAASAADLPGKAPVSGPPAAAPPIWNGFYLGLNAGGVWSRTDVDWDPNFIGFGPGTGLLKEGASGRINSSGFTGGGQFGINKQLGDLVFGVETDFQYTGLSGVRSGGVFIPPALGGPAVDSFRESLESSRWLGTLRARLGVAFGSLLPYATGGAAIARVSYSDFGYFPFFPSTNAASLSETRLGWTIGGGLEWKFAPQWSIKAEYLYVDLGTTSYMSLNSVVGAVASISHEHHLVENIARVGLNYTFWSLVN